MSDINIDANCTFSYLHIYQQCTCRTVEFENEDWLSCHMVYIKI